MRARTAGKVSDHGAAWILKDLPTLMLYGVDLDVAALLQVHLASAPQYPPRSSQRLLQHRTHSSPLASINMVSEAICSLMKSLEGKVLQSILEIFRGLTRCVVSLDSLVCEDVVGIYPR